MSNPEDDEISVWDDVLKEDDVMTVAADETKKAETGVLDTRDLTTCIALGVYDPGAQNGYMVHMDSELESATEYTKEFREFVFGLIQDGLNYENGYFTEAKAFIGGSCMPPASEADYTSEIEANSREKLYGSRGIVHEYVRNEFQNVETEWGSETSHVARLLLDVNKGEFNYDRSYAESTSKF